MAKTKTDSPLRRRPIPSSQAAPSTSKLPPAGIFIRSSSSDGVEMGSGKSWYQAFRQRTCITVCGLVTVAVLFGKYMALDNESPPSVGTEGTSGGAEGGGPQLSPLEGSMRMQNQERFDDAKNKEQPPSLPVVEITEGTVHMGTDPSTPLPYYHCGLTPGGGGGGTVSAGSSSFVEMILLHGAKFTKEEWKKYGLLDRFCSRPGLSVTALDLSVREDGLGLSDAFHALWSSGVISGSPAVIVTPSASGKTVVHLGELAGKGKGRRSVAGDDGEEEDGDNSAVTDPSKLLKFLVRAWIAVAPGSVLSTSENSIRAFPDSEVPVLSVHGHRDAMGKKVTERLVSLAGAKGVEIGGGHPCYLDSPDDFVRTVMEWNWGGGEGESEGKRRLRRER